MDPKFYEYLLEKVNKKSADLYFRATQQALALEDPVSILQDEKKGPSRRDTFRKALLHYASFSGNTELAARLAKIEIPGRWSRQRTVRALSQDEWFSLLEAIQNLAPSPLRATLMILSTSGLRISEVLDLSRDCLEQALEEGKAITTQKGGSERWYLIASEDQWAASSELLEAMTKTKNQVWKVLLDRRWTKRDSVISGIRRALEQAATTAGVKKHVHPHMLRRTAGDAVRRACGGDMKVVQDLLGHKSMKTTIEWYQDHTHPEEVQEALGKALERK